MVFLKVILLKRLQRANVNRHLRFAEAPKDDWIMKRHEKT
jgi:hypothetical protein